MTPPHPAGRIPLPRAAVAQLDRVPGFEPGGRGFESLRPRHKMKKYPLPLSGYFFILPARRKDPELPNHAARGRGFDKIAGSDFGRRQPAQPRAGQGRQRRNPSECTKYWSGHSYMCSNTVNGKANSQVLASSFRTYATGSINTSFRTVRLSSRHAELQIFKGFSRRFKRFCVTLGNCGSGDRIKRFSPCVQFRVSPVA